MRYVRRRPRRAVAFAALAIVFIASQAAIAHSTSESASQLPRPDTWRPASLEAPGDGPTRYEVLLEDQDLLAAAAKPRIRALLGIERQSSTRVGGLGRMRISAAELRSARANERSFERGIAMLEGASLRSNAEVRQLSKKLEALGVRVLETETMPATVIVRTAPGLASGIADLTGVAAVRWSPRPRPLSGLGTQVVGAPTWWAAGHTGGTGSNDTVPADAAIQSEAADPTHPAFGGLTVDNDPTLTPGDHGTHTGGILASEDPAYPGVARGMDRLIGTANEAYALGVTVSGEPGAADPAESINYSFGAPATDDDEDDASDVVTALFSVGQAQAGGNENDDGSPTVNNIGRNVLSVAAFNDVGTLSTADDVVLGTSSRGPSPGGRKKPDLTAPGGAVIAPSSFWNSPPSNPDFTGMSGTSFSTPHVAGAMTLLEGAGIGDPMAQRAILINSARDWSGTSTGLAGWAAPQSTWRPEVGWGSLDLTRALAERGNYLMGAVRGGEASYYRATMPTGGKATLAFQLRGFFVGFPDPGTQTMKFTQSNLDLHQYLPDGTEIAPSADPGHGGGPGALDPNDTVEQVRAPVGGPQEIVYKVQAASSIDGTDAEPFAVSAAAPLEELDAPEVRPQGITTTPGTPVSCSDDVIVATSLRNDSPDLDAENAEAQLQLPAGVQLLSGSPTQQVSGGTLEAATTSELRSWTVRATEDGLKTITISGSGGAFGTELSRTAQVDIEADCLPPPTTIDGSPNELTNDPNPTLEFSSTGGASFECSIDLGAFAVCNSPLTLPSLQDGSHSFRVRAIDSVGNADPTPASAEFTVDTEPPGTEISAGPDGATKARRPRFRFSSDGGAGFKCSVDRKAFTSCASPYRTVRLSIGRHRFRVRAVDLAGNVDRSPASRRFKVERR